MSTKTPEEAKAEFINKGESVAAWALSRGFTPQEVYKVLNGQSKGRIGKAHQIAVALGIKADPSAAA